MSSESTASGRAPWAARLSARSAQWFAEWELVRGRPSYDLTIFLISLAAFMLVVPFGDFDTIIGDNIAQVGYWRILFHRAFVGSCGASSMKPGLIFLLGAAHDLSLAVFHSTVLIKAVFALAGAGLATIVARIARDAAGPIAGVGAVVYMMTQTAVPEMYITGTSMLLFLPLLLWGVWLFARHRPMAGAVVLCVAASIRIEAFMVLFVLALSEQLFQRKWRAFMLSSAVVFVSLVITALVYYLVQGSVARFNAGGPPVGYVFSHEPSATIRFIGSLEYVVVSSARMLFEQSGFPYLGAAAVFGWALDRARRYYLSLLGIPLFLIVYIATGQGSPELRYFHFLAPVTAALGAAGIARAIRIGGRAHTRAPSWLWLSSALGAVASFVFAASKPLCSLSLLIVALSVGALSRKLRFTRPAFLRHSAWALVFAAVWLQGKARGAWRVHIGPADYTVDALSLLKHSPVPKGQRIMTEDDIIYGVLVRDRTFFGKAQALQDFNLKDDTERAEILARTDYIIVSRRRHPYYFLIYDPLRQGRGDPFRAVIDKARRRGKAGDAHGYHLVPVEVSKQWIVMKVEAPQSAT